MGFFSGVKKWVDKNVNLKSAVNTAVDVTNNALSNSSNKSDQKVLKSVNSAKRLYNSVSKKTYVKSANQVTRPFTKSTNKWFDNIIDPVVNVVKDLTGYKPKNEPIINLPKKDKDLIDTAKEYYNKYKKESQFGMLALGVYLVYYLAQPKHKKGKFLGLFKF